MSTDLKPIADKTFARINADGLVEVVDEKTGLVIALQETYADLFKSKRDRLVTHTLEDGTKLLIEKGMNIENVSKNPNSQLYSGLLADIICQRIAEGETYKSICNDKEHNMPNYATICRWRREHEGFREALKEAKKDRADFFHDNVVDNMEKGLDKDDVAGARLYFDQLRWAAEKSNPEDYGTKVKQVDGGGAVNLTIVTGVPQNETLKDVGEVIDVSKPETAVKSSIPTDPVHSIDTTEDKSVGVDSEIGDDSEC